MFNDERNESPSKFPRVNGTTSSASVTMKLMTKREQHCSLFQGRVRNKLRN